MNKQTLYIIFIINLFNFLFINIFKLQKDISNIRDKTKIKELIDLNNLNNLNFKYLNNDDTGFIPDVIEVMNEIAKLVPIDVNKIYPSKEKFVPKSVQVLS